MVKKAKKEHYQNISLSEITDNKFWKTVRPLFGNKVKTNQKINLIEKNVFVTSDEEIAKTFKKYFAKIVPKLNLIQNDCYIRKTGNIEDPLKKASFKYRYHPSISNIKDMKSKNTPSFSFQPVSIDKVKDIIKTLNTKKACPDGDIPVKLIKMNEDIFFSRLIFQNFNLSLMNGDFPHRLKQPEAIHVFKKEEKLDKTNYRPVSILPIIYKLYERLMYDQMYKYLDQIFSKFQCGFRKGFSTQNCLLYMIENWKESLDQGGHYSALLTDLSKAFDCTMHDLLIAKLQAYCFNDDSLNFVCNYLVDREQRVKINSSFSTLSKIEYGVPQGSILGSLIFNINTLDIFFEQKDVNFLHMQMIIHHIFVIKTLKYFSVSIRYAH